jgi:hypothetical protein
MAAAVYPIHNEEGACIGVVYRREGRFEGLRRWRNKGGWPASTSTGIHPDRSTATAAVREVQVRD